MKLLVESWTWGKNDFEEEYFTDESLAYKRVYELFDKGREAKIHRVINCCGEDIFLHGFTNTCPTCGKDYNSNGQLLAPRCQWGEETGELWSECY